MTRELSDPCGGSHRSPRGLKWAHRRVLAMPCADLRGIAPDRPLARTDEPGAHRSVLLQANDTATDPTRSERLCYSPDVHRQKPGPRKCREPRDLLHGRVQ